MHQTRRQPTRRRGEVCGMVGGKKACVFFLVGGGGFKQFSLFGGFLSCVFLELITVMFT